MIPDADLLAAIVAHRKPVERRRLAGLLGIDDDAELAGTLARLTREGTLDRIRHENPGNNVGYCYWPTGRGKQIATTTPPAAAPAPTQPVEEQPMGIHANSRREEIVAHIANNPGSTAGDLATEFKLTPDQAAQELWALNKAGKIHVIGSSRPRAYNVGPATEQASTAPAGTAPKTTKAPKKEAPQARRVARGRRPKQDTLLAPKAPLPVPTPTNGFRVALTSDDTLLMERPHSNERVELQRHEVGVLTAFLRKLDSLEPLPS